MRQIDLDYNGSLLQQYKSFQQVVAASVHGGGKPFANIAGDLDMSSSELSRRISDNPNDTLKFILYRFDDLLAATGDLRPLYWLIEKFCQDSDAKRRQAVSDLAHLMPKLEQLLRDASA